MRAIAMAQTGRWFSDLRCVSPTASGQIETKKNSGGTSTILRTIAVDCEPYIEGSLAERKN
jgi:hypothetical protein